MDRLGGDPARLHTPDPPTCLQLFFVCDGVALGLGRVMEAQLEAPTLLGTDHASRKIWLVKVPQFVAERWRGVCDQAAQNPAAAPAPVLGTLTWGMAAGPNGAAVPDASVKLQHASTTDIPQDYALAIATQSMPSMIAFSETGGKVAVEGRLYQKFDLQVDRRPPEGARGSAAAEPTAPVDIDPTYRRLSRERSKEAATRNRTVQVISQRQFTDLRKPILAPQRKLEPSERRLAKPAEELTADLFRLFERQKQWNFSQLQRQTEQPTNHLKAVLQEIAVQNRRGPYKDLWELKKGYKLT